jgi:hypothetical protein
MYAHEIKAAIEYPSKVGNVTTTFPHYGVNNDSIRTACSPHVNHTNGGFLVQFNTEFGNIPLLSARPDTNITITEYQKGTSHEYIFLIDVMLYLCRSGWSVLVWR